MTRLIIGFVTGLATGLAVYFAPVGNDSADPDAVVTNRPIAAVECTCDVQPGNELERALHDEREANVRLRSEIAGLRADLEQLTSAPPASGREFANWLNAARVDLAADDVMPDQRQALIDVGFAPARAEWILGRVAALQMEALQQSYREPDAGGPMDFLASRLAGRQALRDELGDFEYEQYLAATGQSTTIAVTGVLPASPAQQAGLEIGDEIVDYAGERVFNMIELAERARNVDPAASVVVNIVRDGAPMQMVLPGGALGVMGGRPLQR